MSVADKETLESLINEECQSIDGVPLKILAKEELVAIEARQGFARPR